MYYKIQSNTTYIDRRCQGYMFRLWNSHIQAFLIISCFVEQNTNLTPDVKQKQHPGHYTVTTRQTFSKSTKEIKVEEIVRNIYVPN
jgi:hypothetical protein